MSLDWKMLLSDPGASRGASMGHRHMPPSKKAPGKQQSSSPGTAVTQQAPHQHLSRVTVFGGGARPEETGMCRVTRWVFGKEGLLTRGQSL